MPHTTEITHLSLSIVYFLYALTGWDFEFGKNFGGYAISFFMVINYYTLYQNAVKTWSAMQKYYNKDTNRQVLLKLFGIYYPFLALYIVFFIYLQTLKNSNSDFESAAMIRCFYSSLSLKNTIIYFRVIYFSLVSPEAMLKFGWKNKIHFFYLDVLVVNFITALEIMEASAISVIFLIYNLISFFFTFIMASKRVAHHLNLNFIYNNESK